MDGAVTFGLGLCGNYLAGGLDGGFDYGIDGGAVCTGAADHAGYESDVLGDGGDGLFGGGGVGWEGERVGLSIFLLYGDGIFGQGPDGLGGTAIGGSGVGVGGEKEWTKTDSSVEKRDGINFWGGAELVCVGLSEVP